MAQILLIRVKRNAMIEECLHIVAMVMLLVAARSTTASDPPACGDRGDPPACGVGDTLTYTRSDHYSQ